jgi:hypothetical protein
VALWRRRCKQSGLLVKRHLFIGLKRVATDVSAAATVKLWGGESRRAHHSLLELAGFFQIG